jgi:hypothetical protein
MVDEPAHTDLEADDEHVPTRDVVYLRHDDESWGG